MRRGETKLLELHKALRSMPIQEDATFISSLLNTFQLSGSKSRLQFNEFLDRDSSVSKQSQLQPDTQFQPFRSRDVAHLQQPNPSLCFAQTRQASDVEDQDTQDRILLYVCHAWSVVLVRSSTEASMQ